MDKSVKNVKEPNIYFIIPIYYLSKLTGLATLSLAYTRDKDMRLYISLKSSAYGILYAVLLIMAIIAGQICVLIFSYDFKVAVETKSLYLSELFLRGVSSVTSLVVCLTKVRKVLNNLLNIISCLDDVFRTPNKVLKRNETFLQIQVLFMIPIVCIMYLIDHFAYQQGFDIWTLYFVTTYICTSIELVTISQFVNLTLLLKQKFQILNRYLASGENLPQHDDNGNLWETLLQTSCLRNMSNLENGLPRRWIVSGIK
jgi:hypothetical protein